MSNSSQGVSGPSKPSKSSDSPVRPKKPRIPALTIEDKLTVVKTYQQIYKNWPQGEYWSLAACQKKTSEKLGINATTVRKLCSKYQKTGYVSAPVKSGVKTTLEHEVDILTILVDPGDGLGKNIESIYLKVPAKDSVQGKERRALNAQALKITLGRIQENPQLYIGIPKNCYHIVNLLHKQTKIPTTLILLCLKKVKLDTHFEELADQFGITSKSAKYIFIKNIPIIAKALQSFIANLDSETIKSNLPIPFRKHQNIATVIDTLELKVQPTTAQCKELTQSENGNTIKYLISCCPDGFIDYVSPGYGGRQTDENLLESTGYLDRFDPGTCIITKGFKNAEPLLLRKGMKLLRPQSCTKQSSPRAGQDACKRISDDQIERVVQRVREFAMIKDNTAISSDLVRVLDQAVVISCALINLQRFVIN